METKIVQQALNEFGSFVVRRAQENLKRGGRYGTYNASGNLSRSLTFKTKINPNSLEFDFFAESNWKLLDYGTKGSQSSNKAPQSPYKASASTGAIDKWVIRKGIKGTRSASGQFTNRKALVDAIKKSINKTGTYETKFFRSAFELEYKNFNDTIAEKYALDLESFLKYVIDENIKR